MSIHTRFFRVAAMSGLLLLTMGIQAQSNKKSQAKKSPDVSQPLESEGPLQRVRVSFNPSRKQDPMLSPTDLELIEFREKQRRAALEAERRRKEEEERRRREEEEKRMRWEKMIADDPSILIRDKIRISGIIDKEVLIGSKLYTIGNTYMGAKIVAVGSDSVTFLYRGKKFVKKLKL